MKRMFPEMTGCMSTGLIVCGLAWWTVAFVLAPFVLTLFDYRDWARVDVTPWVECLYNAANAIVLIRILKESLSDGIFEIQIGAKSFLLTLFGAFAAAAVYVMLIAHPVFAWLGDENALTAFFNALPITEMSVLGTPTWVIAQAPVVGTVCFAILTPFAVAGMFYATAFAPVCCKVRWLGYLTVAVLLLLPVGFKILWRGDAAFTMIIYLVRLPIHWIACWSYQKTSNIWAPIGTLALVNLGTALMCLPV